MRAYSIAAPQGFALRVRVDHPHLDLSVRALGPEGALLAETENILNRTDPLTLTAIVTQAGPQRIEVRLGPKGNAGRFRIALGAAPATQLDRSRMEAERLRAEADRISAAQDAPHFSRALEAYGAAAARWKTLGDPLEQAMTLTRQGQLLEQMSRLPESRSTLEEARALWRAAGEGPGESDCLDGLGLVVTEQGDPRAGLAILEEALALRRSAGPSPYSEGSILNDMAVALGNLGDLPGAIDHYTEALALARADGDLAAQAQVLRNRAGDYQGLGEPERALYDFQRARDQFHALGDVREEGTTWYAIGIALTDLGRRSEAWSAFQTAHRLLEKAGDPRFVAFTLEHLGVLRLDARQYREATALFQESLQRLESGGDRRSVATARMNLARVQTESGNARAAIQPLAEVRAELHAIGDRGHEAVCLTHLARAEMAYGMLLQARDHLLEALRLTEELRGSIQGPSARAAYAASEHGRYELLAGVLMALHAREPGKGWDAQALEASETARARSLLEVLTAARADIAADVDPALRTAEKDLDGRLEKSRQALTDVLGRAHRTDEADAVERELESLRAERERLEARMRASSPRYAALAPAAPLTVAEIRERLLDDDTVLVEYLVGEKQSFVWAISRSALRSAVLPGRPTLERAVARVVRRWSDPGAPDDAPDQARALSRTVLGPVAQALNAPRLVVVADGALQQLPFAALPVPGTGRALLEAHAIVGSPSASVLVALRERAPVSGRGAELAVLADPVLGQPPRQGRPDLVASRSPLLARSLEDAGLRALDPLPGSRREALAIAALVPADRVLTAFGPEASRATAMGAGVARARIVHFATHALLDVRRPELSGIVLSDRDAEGRPQNGFLSLADISGLRLSADLVVLSACRTGLGKEVRGEGLMGLTRGFMDAGAPRVVASLWKVSDVATAELMSRFYALMLEERLAPAEALRQAQLALRKERRTSAPHAWAGFTLQGDWRPLEEARVSGAGQLP
jgi:CHAT domain-containing protein